MASVKTTAEIREAFLEYFEQAGHARVASSPLVPGNDPTLLFTNAGMVPFKDVFTGRETRDYVRATSAQRCVRAGGKHNDLENVGYTARHHTFFEMLGNFSFGDYFKAEAIRHAWTLVTEGFGIPVDRLWVTVHLSDDEAERIWIEDIGVAPERVTRLDEDNFWSMGDTGPCGPCSEIFYDHGPEVPGGPPGSPDEDGDRYVEIWNLVFMQFERAADGTMTDLPKPSVDTGMGLERVAAVLQGVHSNYEIDLFQALIEAVADVTGASARAADQLPSLRVIADHIRSSAFLIVDGVLPGNEGRGYVLRRIIRRALRHGHRLGQQDAFFNRLVGALVEAMGGAYPELARQQAHVERVLAQEEEQFARTLATGMAVFEEEVARLDGTVIPGAVVFRLYDTYGFPVDLTADVARERELTIDEEGFEEEMRAQRDRARAASRFGAVDDDLRLDTQSDFTGYEEVAGQARIVELFALDEGGERSAVEHLEAGSAGLVVLDRTPFYAESGGQVGDTGVLVADGAGRFLVEDTQLAGSGRVHRGRVDEGRLSVGAEVDARIDAARRQRIKLNHSATHLLHAALREILGDHVEQKGSLVTADRLRFDFSHYQGVEPEELARIEARVNDQIWANSEVATRLMSFDAARDAGAMALFGEKYGDEVRVLSMGNGYSVELCGGTHVERTGDIGVLRITSESGIASGVRRIEAVSGPAVVERMNDRDALIDRIGGLLRSGPEELATRVEGLISEQRVLEKQLSALQARVAAAQGEALLSGREQIGDVAVLATVVEGVEAKALPELLDSLRDRLGRAVVVLGSVEDGKVALIAGVSRELTDRLRAGDIVKHVGAATGAKGGGRPDMARAGGGDRPEALPEALASVADLVREAFAA